jgi:hypothetical protein
MFRMCVRYLSDTKLRPSSAVQKDNIYLKLTSVKMVKKLIIKGFKIFFVLHNIYNAIFFVVVKKKLSICDFFLADCPEKFTIQRLAACCNEKRKEYTVL